MKRSDPPEDRSNSGFGGWKTQAEFIEAVQKAMGESAPSNPPPSIGPPQQYIPPRRGNWDPWTAMTRGLSLYGGARQGGKSAAASAIVTHGGAGGAGYTGTSPVGSVAGIPVYVNQNIPPGTMIVTSAGAATGPSHPMAAGPGWTGSADLPSESLPVESQADVITAWKGGMLHVSKDQIWISGPQFTDHHIRPVEVAECKGSYGRPEGVSQHEAPDPTGRHECGFNAMNTVERARKAYSNVNVILEVELYGRVTIGTLGYRAQKQRVLTAWLVTLTECAAWLCTDVPTYVEGRPVSGDDDEWLMEDSSTWSIRGLCAQHAQFSMNARSVSDLTARFGYEVRCGDPASTQREPLDMDPEEDERH